MSSYRNRMPSGRVKLGTHAQAEEFLLRITGFSPDSITEIPHL